LAAINAMAGRGSEAETEWSSMRMKECHCQSCLEFDAKEEKFREWIRQLDEDVIQGEFGYEDGEFTIYLSHWRALYDDGLTPSAAWQRALDGFANVRRDEEGRKIENYARIVAEDEAAVARDHRGEKRR
jgi:hypothetical protein